jgi:8-oxo-dGTP pyrophosphatase MutT (NUDIX family)
MSRGLVDRLRAAVDPLPPPGTAPPPEVTAAVLLLTDPDGPGLPLLFIRRTRRVRTHRGQIAFPGGGVEPGDGGVVGAAVRETQEELGVAAADVEPLGLLSPVVTRGSQRGLCPVVALQRRAVEPVPDGWEVAEWFRLPVAELLTAPLTTRRIPGMEGDGRDGVVHFYEARGRVIWGATAAVLHDLLGRLRATATADADREGAAPR